MSCHVLTWSQKVSTSKYAPFQAFRPFWHMHPNWVKWGKPWVWTHASPYPCMYTTYDAHGPHGPKGPLGAYGVYGHAPHTYHIYFYRGLVTSWTSNALGAQQHLKGLRRHRGINTPFDHLPTDHQPSPQGGWSRPLMAPDPSQPLRPPETTSRGLGSWEAPIL